MPRTFKTDRGGSIHTFTGKRVFPLDLKPADVDIRDLAHHLAMIVRYGGAVREHYSVAQHSVLVSQLVLPENAAHALLHDGSEAYLGDIVRPLKNTNSFGSKYRKYEAKAQKVIYEKFGLSHVEPDDVKEADLRICTNELRDLLGVEQKRPTAFDDLTIIPVLPAEAEQMFLQRAVELGIYSDAKLLKLA